jgi:hypothetical protein
MNFYITITKLMGENMFVVHDFTYEPLNFQKNMFAIHNFSKKTSNFVIVHPKTLLSMNFMYESVNIWEKYNS